eukprot:m.293160 g.293160  ORF g.293160 m.293160 type:complete len:555 (+) comp18755_c0_seq1:423-2087(+)
MIGMSDDDETLERRFKCPVCSKVYSKIAHLKRHQKSHVEAKKHPFKCGTCNRTFTRRDHYNFHLKSHNKERLRCHQCSKAYKHAVSLKRHLRAAHSLDWTMGQPIDSAMPIHDPALPSVTQASSSSSTTLPTSLPRQTASPRAKRRKSSKTRSTQASITPSTAPTSASVSLQTLPPEPAQSTSPPSQVDPLPVPRSATRTTRSRHLRTSRLDPPEQVPKQAKRRAQHERPTVKTSILSSDKRTEHSQPTLLPRSSFSQLHSARSTPLRHSTEPSPLDVLARLSATSIDTLARAGLAAPSIPHVTESQPADTASSMHTHPLPFQSDQQRALQTILQALLQQQQQPPQTLFTSSQRGALTHSLSDAIPTRLQRDRSQSAYTAAVEPTRPTLYRSSSTADSSSTLGPRLQSDLDAVFDQARSTQPQSRSEQLAGEQLARFRERLAPPAMAQSQPLSSMQLLTREIQSSARPGLPPSGAPSSSSLQLSTSALSDPLTAPDDPRLAHPLVQLTAQAYSEIDQSMSVAQQSLFDAILEELAKADDNLSQPTTTASGLGWP